VELARGIGPGALPYVQRVIEYPVVIGFALYVAASLAPGTTGVFLLTALASLGLAVAVALLLNRSPNARPWRFVLGVPLVLYAFQNWDLFAVVPALVGVIAFARGRDRLAGTALGIGAATKLFPGVLALPLAALRWSQGDRAGARRVLLWAGGTFAVLNLPLLVAAPTRWWWTYRFQGARHATWGSAWYYLYRVPGVHTLVAHDPAGIANVASLVALVGGIAWLTRTAARRRLEPAAVALAAVAIFVLANKVYSPNYDLWLLPFLALLPSPRRLLLAFVALDLAIYYTVFGAFHDFSTYAFLHVALPLFVVGRAVVLVLIVRDATRARRYPPAPAPAASEALANEASSRAMSGPAGV
jgi:uncharacterized membrane protein